MDRITFPQGFLWGAASAAYQVEGSPLADGAGPTTWHRFTHERGRVADGSTGDAACDSYRAWESDIPLMKELGIKAYRFSVGWGRVFPEKGRLNPRGLDYYERLVDGLLKAGIEPWLTIFHMEEPLWLARQGGFTSRAAVDSLVELGAAVFSRLGDRVRGWITVNEPSIHAYEGYIAGEFPPGRRFDIPGMVRCQHHLVLAHARLCGAWEAAGRPGSIGIAHHHVWVSPADPGNRRDVGAAALMDDLANRSVLDPLFRGTYPERGARAIGRFLPRGFEKDLAEMRTVGTYLGINYYTRNTYAWSPWVPFLHAIERGAPRAARSAMWEIYPRGIHDTLMRLRDEYGNPPCYVTENGFPLIETRGAPILDDDERIAYLRGHIGMVGRAIAEGADCRGYFHWSLMDNFEWNKGLRMRFGLLRTDFKTQRRQWKNSARWYQGLIRENALDA
jgi:beta-glucosidase